MVFALTWQTGAQVIETNKPAPKFAVHGRVIGPDDKPVTGASVERDGIGMDRGKGWGWENEGWPEHVITDTNGEFIYGRDKAFKEIQIRINAPTLAPYMEWLGVSNGVQTIKLGVGAVACGRVLKDGKPLGGVRIGVSGSERNSEVFAGHYETDTKEDGTFEFSHLPPATGWWIYGIMSSFKDHSAIASRQILTAADGTTNDLSDLSTTPGLHLAGEIKTRHGEPLPKGLTISLGTQSGWDSQKTKVNADGHFRFDGIYNGPVNVWVRSKHWRLSGANSSEDLWNPGSLTGLLEGNKDDLVVEIEKGENDYNGGNSSGNGQLPQADWPQSRPLQGAETSGQPPIVLDGQAVDDETGRLISSFKVVPGYQPPRTATASKTIAQQILKPFAKKSVPWNELPYWENRHTSIVSNGIFSLEFLSLSSKPIFKIEAASYDPYESEPISVTTRNLLIRLKHGVGPNGVVLLPGGEPATNATVIFAASREAFQFYNKSISPNGYRDAEDPFRQVTAKQGSFSFQARAAGRTIFVAHPDGWAEEDVRHGGKNLKLRLEPWATVTGTLIFANGTPASNVVLEVTTSENNWGGDNPYFYFQRTSTTDKQGHFEFHDLPPRELHINRRTPLSSHSWSSTEQTWFVAKAGLTNDLGKVIYDTPPPPPVGERLRRNWVWIREFLFTPSPSRRW